MKSATGIFIAILALTVSVLTGCSRDADESGEAEAPKNASQVVSLTAESIREMGLTMAVAEIAPLTGEMSLPATLLPNQDLEAHVGSMVQGRVRKVFANVGDRVAEGRVLMQIEGLEVGQIQSSFIQAKAHLSYTEANYQRQKTLLEQKVGSQKALLESQAEYEKARAEFNGEDKRIHSIGLTDSDILNLVDPESKESNGHIGGMLPVKAPITGTIVERNVVIGQLVDASTLAFRIINSSTLWAEGQVSESALALLTGNPDVTFSVTAYPGEVFNGKVVYISPIVDERSRTITLRASIPNPKGRLKPQMFGELHVPIGGTATGMLIDLESVQKDGEDTYVFAATSDTTFERRDVTLGATFDHKVEITSGINPGDRIVIKGAFQLRSELLKNDFAEGD
ncbi:MAG: efflux RND transporter periplasmic adaptor subunit [Bacteroidota bacterium]